MQLLAFVVLAVKENAEQATGRMDAINKQITALPIFKMERCFLLTRGQPYRNRSKKEEDNKNREIKKGKNNLRDEKLTCDFLLSYTVPTNTS